MKIEKTTLLPFAVRDRQDFVMEIGQEIPKLITIIASKTCPIVTKLPSGLNLIRIILISNKIVDNEGSEKSIGEAKLPRLRTLSVLTDVRDAIY